MSKFIHNKTTSTVSLIDSRVLIPVGQSLSISDTEAEHDDVIYAKRKGWITVEDSKDSATPAPAPAKAPVAEKNPMEGSTTIPTKEVPAVEPVKEEAPAPAVESTKKAKK